MSEFKAVIKHTYDASPDELYEAFTNPNILKEWYCPEGMSIPEVVAEARVGGQHRVVMQAPDGTQHIANGEYKELIPAKKLVYTWKWENPEMNNEALITVEFIPKGAQTEVVMTHDGLPNQKEVDMHSHGWNSCLVKLEKVVA
jgi:uncharacterized protein YndB with AHSA1/START domain